VSEPAPVQDSPIQNILLDLEARTGHRPIQNRKGWMTRCPAHDDKDPSLSVSLGIEGNILLKCFGGCATESILETMAWTWSDLYADEPHRASGISRIDGQGNKGTRERKQPSPRGRS